MRYVFLLLAVIIVSCGPSLEARKEYVQTHDRPEYIEQAILNEKVSTGMNEEDVEAVFGKPDSINESYYQGTGSQTQWCYHGSYDMMCIYFEGGTVTGWN